MFIVAVSGGMGSGKTVLSKRLSDATDGVVLSFGAYFRHKASLFGVKCDRASLQLLGAKMIGEIGVVGVMNDMIDLYNVGNRGLVIVDGIRQGKYYRQLVDFFGGGILIFTECDVEERKVRIAQRDCVTIDQIDAALLHETEMDIESLRGDADYIINTRKNTSDIDIDNIVNLIRIGGAYE